MKTTFVLLMMMAVTITVACLNNAQAEEFDGIWDKDRFQIRGRVIGILADGDGVVNGTNNRTDVDDEYVPEVDFTYFFTKNVAAELIVATAEHTVTASALGTLGDAWILPPTLTLQYHFQPDEKFSPYVGAGINYSMFYGEDEAAPYNKLDVDGGLGWAVQAGFDYWLNDNWGLNLDAKYIDVDIDARVNSAANSADDVELNPWVVGVGVSYRF